MDYPFSFGKCYLNS